MKCGYCGEDVPKEEAIKDGRYYHKKCHRIKQGKREIEDYWLSQINSGTVLQLLRKCIKDWVELYEVDYVLYVLKKVSEEGIKLQYPQGLKRLLDESRYKEGWQKIKIRKATSGMDNEFEKYANKEQSIIKYKNKPKNFTKIL